MASEHEGENIGDRDCGKTGEDLQREKFDTCYLKISTYVAFTSK